MSSRNSGKQFAGIQFLSPPSCYCCFPLNSWSLQPERRFLSSGFVSLGNSPFVSKATCLGQWNSEAESTFVHDWVKRDPSCHWSREHSFSLKLVCMKKPAIPLDPVSTWTCWPYKIKPAHQVNFNWYNGKATLTTSILLICHVQQSSTETLDLHKTEFGWSMWLLQAWLFKCSVKILEKSESFGHYKTCVYKWET